MQLVMIILCIVGLASGASLPRSNSPQNRNQVVIAVSTEKNDPRNHTNGHETDEK
jgi:hypothetical protein